jgi:hypothetical protein
MTKEELIKKIEGLYPIDSEFPDTNTIGEFLLMRAMKEAKFDWRDLPESVLTIYLRECIEEERSGELTETLRQAGMI